jgi:hypothetical protein
MPDLIRHSPSSLIREVEENGSRIKSGMAFQPNPSKDRPSIRRFDFAQRLLRMSGVAIN